MIARGEEDGSPLAGLPFPSPYALETQHKHVPEMTKYTGLDHRPHFLPAVIPTYAGMRVEISLHGSLLANDADGQSIWQTLHQRYENEQFINVVPLEEAAEYSEPAFDPRVCNGTNRMVISVIQNDVGHVLLVMQIDNLGKGAGGAAVQNMNLMLGFDEAAGLGH